MKCFTQSVVSAFLFAATNALELTDLKSQQLATKYGVSLGAVNDAVLEYNQINLAEDDQAVYSANFSFGRYEILMILLLICQLVFAAGAYYFISLREFECDKNIKTEKKKFYAFLQ